MTPYGVIILVNIDSCDGLLLSDTKPLPEPKLNYRIYSQMEFDDISTRNNQSRYQSPECVYINKKNNSFKFHWNTTLGGYELSLLVLQQTGTNRDNCINTITVDDLAPWIAKVSTIMILIMMFKRVLVFHDEGYKPPVLPQCWEMIGNANTIKHLI